MFTRSLRNLFALLAIALVAGCASVPDPLEATAWRDPAYSGRGFARIFVVGLSARSLSDQRGFENLLVSSLQRSGIDAVPGWQFVPRDVTPDQSIMRDAVARAGADAMLLVRVSPPTTETAWGYGVGAVTAVAPDMYVGVYEPGVFSEDYQAAVVYSTLFDVATSKPVYTYNPPVFSPGTFAQQAPAFAADLVSSLVESGLVRTP